MWVGFGVLGADWARRCQIFGFAAAAVPFPFVFVEVEGAVESGLAFVF